MQYDQLRIVMAGSRCNLKCSYCIAGYDDRGELHDSEINTMKIMKLIRPHTFSSISIWGGEPFFNFPKLKAIVEFCREQYARLPIIIISNGTVLSREKIDFIKKYHINVTLSHDAFCQHYRGKDYLKDEKSFSLIREMKQLGFISVIHKYNCDFQAIFNYFDAIRNRLNRDFFWSFELLQPAGPASERFLPGGDEVRQFSQSLDFLLRQFVEGHPFAYTGLHPTLSSMASVIDRNTKVRCRCGAHRRFTVTTDGRTAFCQVRAERGLFDDPALDVPDMCECCEVSRFCRGYCPGMTVGARRKMCRLYKVFYTKLYGFLLNLYPQEASSSENEDG